MALQLKLDVGRDYNNALFLATACDLAYLSPEAGTEEFKAKLGLDAQLCTVNNTQAYVGQSPQSIVVAFRGSESPTSLDGLKDWFLTNAKNFLTVPTGRMGTDFLAAGVGAKFHSGFIDALGAIWTPLFAAVDAAFSAKERPVWVTGHSLGGAIALLAAWRLQRQFIPIHQVYTFGAPMIGNDAAAQAFAKEFPSRIFRFVDMRDLVPKLPTFSLFSNEYDHCLEEVALGVTEGAGSAGTVLKQLATQAKDQVLDSATGERVWGHLRQGLDCHLMGNYLKEIEGRLKA